MKRTLAPILATLVALGFAGLAIAGDEPHREFHLKLGTDAEVLDLDVDDLEVGESRQFFSDSGQEIVVTRSEEGYEIEADGETIDVRSGDHHGAGQHAVFISHDGEDVDFDFDTEIHHGEGHAMHWVTTDGGDVTVHAAAHSNVAEELLESGVLDDLDPGQRDAILEKLREITRAKQIRVHKKVVIAGDEDPS